MQYSETFNKLRLTNIHKYLLYKRENLRNEEELNIVDLKIKDIENQLYSNNEQVVPTENTVESFFKKFESEIDKYSYFKTWTKLTNDQKITKIDEYVDKLIQSKNINDVKIYLEELLNNNKLNTKIVKYDSKKGVISNIPLLKYNNETDEYDLCL